MGLNSVLSAMKQESAAKADPAILAIMQTARQQLADSGLLQSAVSQGEIMPDFTLQDSSDLTFSSQAAREQGPLLLCWYRGIW